MIKTNKRLYSVLLLLILFTGFSSILRAQMPVTIAPQLIPPYSLQLSSYYQGATPRLVVTLINNDLNRPGLQVRLQMSIRGRSSGVQIRTAPTAATSTFVLQSGVPVQLNLNDLMSMFNVNNLMFNGGITAMAYQQNGVLPEDIYDFCFEAFEAVTGEKLSHSGCATAYITFSEPPLLNSPQKASSVKIAEPTNIVFAWTPRHRPNASEPTEYTFQIVEINNSNQGGQTNTLITNPEAAFTQQKILYEEKTSSTSIVYGPAYPMLIPGKMYAWRVKADNMSTNEDRSIFRNGGYSENYYFSAVPNCATINHLVSNTQPGTFSLSWTPVPGINSYTVSYRRKGSNLPWSVQNTNEPAFNVNKLDVGEQYEYMVSFMCNNYPVTTAIQTITIAKPMAIAGAVTWKLTKPAHDKVSYSLASSSGNVSKNGNLNAVWPVAESKELKGTATSVGTMGIVKLYFLIEGNTIDSVIARTDDKGKYKVEFPKSVINNAEFLNGKKEVKINARIPGQTDIATKTLSVNSFSSGDLDGNLTLGLNTVSLNIVADANSKDDNYTKEVEVYVQQSYYEEHLNFYNNKLSGTSIQYNGVEYVLMAKDKGHVNTFSHLPKLQSQKYLLRTKYGPNVTYELIDDTYNGQSGMAWWLQNPDNRIAIEQTVELKESVLLTGTVYYNGMAKDKHTVTLNLKKSNNILTQVSASTDANGKYELKIPTVKETNISYEVMVRDAESRLNNVNAPTEKLDIKSAKDGIIVRDFDFDFGRKTITGIVLDQNKKPMSNVLVKARGTNDGLVYADVKTNKYGFYSFDMPGSIERVELQFESEFTEIQKQTLVVKATKKAIDAAEWTRNVMALAGVKSHSAQELALSDPKVIGLEGNAYEDAFKYLTGSRYVITGAAEAKTVSLQKIKSYAQFKFVFKGGSGKAKIEFPDNLGTLTGSHNEVVKILVPFKDYKLNVTEADNTTALIPFNITRTFNATDTGVTVINIEDYVKVIGTVTNTKKKALKDVEVYIEGINRKVTTDKDGGYSLVVNKNEEYTIRAVLKKHEPYNKAIQLAGNATLNISLEEIKIPEIKTLAGFEFTLTAIKQSDVNPEVYLISGSLTPPDNDVFEASNKDNTLTFEDQPVEVDTLGNASPTMDLRFNETTYSIKAFDFATVELSDDAGIFIAQMKDKNGNDTRAIGGISGSDLTLKLEGESNVSKTGLALKDAKIRNSRHKEVEGLEEEVPEVVFVPKKHKINSLQKEETFKVILSGLDKDSLLFTKLGKLVPTTIVKASGELTEDGLSFEGGIGFPNVAGMKLMDDSKGYLKVNKFTFSENYALEEIEVDVDDQTPELAIQKIRAKLQTVSLYGLASANFGIGIGGYIYTKKPEEGSGADTLFIKEFSFIMKEGKPSITAALRIGGDGIGVKGLSFSQDASQEISLAYDGDEKSFMLKASGKLNYKSKDKDKEKEKGGNKFSASLFPVEINRFEFGTKDWSFLLMASPNAKVSLGVASIKLSKLLVSVGSTGVSKSEMMDFLASDDVKVEDDNDDDKDDNKEMKSEDDSKDDNDDDDKENDNNEEDEDSKENGASDDAFEIVDEKEAAWAVGFKGGLEFGASEKGDSDKKGMSADAHASLLIANINNKISVDINEIGLGIESSAFTLKAKVKFLSNDEKTGFEGEGELMAMGAGLKASFVYYKYNKGGIELGASMDLTFPAPFIIVPPSPPGVAGPIQWYGIGGGFNFNTNEGIYKVEIRGDFNPVGMPKETLLITGGVRILFNKKECTAPFPIPQLSVFGKVNIFKQDWGTVTGTIDFCNARLMVDVDGQIPIIPMTEIKFKGALMAFIDKNKLDNSALFLGVALTKLDILDGLIKGNGFAGIGINVNVDHPLVPKSVKDMWPLIDAGAKSNSGRSFSGFNLNALIEVPKIENSWSAPLGVLEIGYSFKLKGKVNTYAKVSMGTTSIGGRSVPVPVLEEFKLAGNFDVDASGYIDLPFFDKIEAGANLSLGFDGGYGYPSGSSTKKWYAKGHAKAKAYAYYRREVAEKAKIGCNDWCYWSCGNSTWLYDYKVHAKFCLDAKASFDFEQGKPFKYSASLDY